MESSKRHTRVTKTPIEFIFPQSIIDKLIEYQGEVSRATPSRTWTSQGYVNRSNKVVVDYLSKIISNGKIIFTYDKYTCFQHFVEYHLDINIEGNGDTNSHTGNYTIVYDLNTNNSTKNFRFRSYDFHKVLAKSGLNAYSFISKLQDILTLIDYKELSDFCSNLYSLNKEIYLNAIIKSNNKKIKVKQATYPMKLGKKLAEYGIEDKELLTLMLQYITKDRNGWGNARNLERLAKYLNSLDKSVLDDKIIQEAVDIAVIKGILE